MVRTTCRCCTSEFHEALVNAASTVCELCGFRITAERRGAAGPRCGDFYTLAVHEQGRIGVVIGDVCGFGADGEAQLAPILPKVCDLARSRVSPAQLLSELNRATVRRLPIDRFVTALALELDAHRGLLTVSNAAHVPPLVRRDGNVSIVCRRAGAPLGFSEDSIYVDEEHRIGKGDVVVLMTDGVLEAIEVDLIAMSSTRSLFGEAAEGAHGVHRRFLREFEACTHGICTDDMTLLAVEALSEVGASNANGLLQVG